MNIQNEGILDPTPGEENGYVTKDGEWAAVPFGKKFMIIHGGQQGQVFNTLENAKKFIAKQIKSKKKSSSVASLF